MSLRMTATTATLCGLPFSVQALVEPLHLCVVHAGCHRGHEEHVSRHSASALAVSRPGPLSAVVGERSDTHEGGGLAAAEGAELRHFGTEYGGGDGADAWYRAQNAVASCILGVVGDDGADRGLELTDLPIDIADQPLECLDGLRRVVLLFGVAEGRLGLDQLRPRPGQVAEPELGVFARRRNVPGPITWPKRDSMAASMGSVLASWPRA